RRLLAFLGSWSCAVSTRALPLGFVVPVLPQPGGRQAAGGARVVLVEAAQLGGRDRLERLLLDRAGVAQAQVVVEPVVHHLAGRLVVVVLELRPALRGDPVAGVVHLVQGLLLVLVLTLCYAGTVVGFAHYLLVMRV